MNTEQKLAEIREANLSYLMLAQSLIRDDLAQALFHLGISEETAGLIAALTPAQMMKVASGGELSLNGPCHASSCNPLWYRGGPGVRGAVSDLVRPFRRDRVFPQSALGVPPASVEVRAPRPEQPQFVRRPLVPFHMRARVRRVDHLDPLDARADEPPDGSVFHVSRVGDTADPSRRLHQRNRFLGLRESLPLVGGFPVRQVPRERLGERPGMPLLDEGVRNVRSTDRSVAGLVEHRFHPERHVHRLELGDDTLRAGAPLLPARCEVARQVRVLGVECVGEKMNLRPVQRRAQLGPRKDRNSEFGRTAERLGKPVHGIVVCYADDGEPGAVCGTEKGLHGQEPVGVVRMHVKVGEAFHAQRHVGKNGRGDGATRPGERRSAAADPGSGGLQVPALELLIIVDDELPPLELEMPLTDERVDHP